MPPRPSFGRLAGFFGDQIDRKLGVSRHRADRLADAFARAGQRAAESGSPGDSRVSRTRLRTAGMIAQAAEAGGGKPGGGVHSSFIVQPRSEGGNDAMSSTYVQACRGTKTRPAASASTRSTFWRASSASPTTAVLAQGRAISSRTASAVPSRRWRPARMPRSCCARKRSTIADPRGATCFGSSVRVAPEKAVVANCSAVRELDANGTNFGYNPRTGNQRGEFGHNDFYPVALAAAQIAGWDGRRTLLAMLCLDEIRGRLAEVFGLKDHKIDHVLHGAIASAAVYGAMLGATAEQIESAIGLVVAHYVPFRAIRHGEQLSDSKGASAAISAEVAVLSMRRAMRGFVGPADIFRNPQAVFCLFEPPARARGQARSIWNWPPAATTSP